MQGYEIAKYNSLNVLCSCKFHFVEHTNCVWGSGLIESSLPMERKVIHNSLYILYVCKMSKLLWNPLRCWCLGKLNENIEKNTAAFNLWFSMMELLNLVSKSQYAYEIWVNCYRNAYQFLMCMCVCVCVQRCSYLLYYTLNIKTAAQIVLNFYSISKGWIFGCKLNLICCRPSQTLLANQGWNLTFEKWPL